MSVIRFGPQHDNTASRLLAIEQAPDLSGLLQALGGNGSNETLFGPGDGKEIPLEVSVARRIATEPHKVVARAAFDKFTRVGALKTFGAAFLLFGSFLDKPAAEGVSIGSALCSIARSAGFPALGLQNGGSSVVAIYPKGSDVALFDPSAVTFSFSGVVPKHDYAVAASPVLNAPLPVMVDPANLPKHIVELPLEVCRGWHQISMQKWGASVQIVAPHTVAESDMSGVWGRLLEVTQRITYATVDKTGFQGLTVVYGDGQLTLPTLAQCGLVEAKKLNTEDILSSQGCQSRGIVFVQHRGMQRMADGGSYAIGLHHDNPFSTTNAMGVRTLIHEMFHATTADNSKYAKRMNAAFDEGIRFSEDFVKMAIEKTKVQSMEFTKIQERVTELSKRDVTKYDQRVLTPEQLRNNKHHFDNKDEWCAFFSEIYGALFFKDLFDPNQVLEMWNDAKNVFPVTTSFIESIYINPLQLNLAPGHVLVQPVHGSVLEEIQESARLFSERVECKHCLHPLQSAIPFPNKELPTGTTDQ